MLGLVTAALLGSASLAFAQSSSETSTATSSSSTAATTVSSGENTIHTVTVAEAGEFSFDPQVTYAVPGDVVVFEFGSGNHSVIGSVYGYPCIPLEDVVGGDGFYSDWQPVLNSTEKRYWSLTVNSTDPIWYYCGAPGSCIGHGMLGAINPNINQSIDTQTTLAREANYELYPGQPIPQEALNSVSALAATATTVTVSATSTPSSTTTTPAATTSAAAAPASHAHLSPGAIAGIAVGAAVVGIGAAVLFFYLGRHRSMKQEIDNLRRQSNAPPEFRGGMATGSVYGGEDNKHMSQLPPYHPPPSEYYKSPMTPPVSEVQRFSPNPDRFTRFSEASELRAEPRSPQHGVPQTMPHEIYTPDQGEYANNRGPSEYRD